MKETLFALALLLPVVGLCTLIGAGLIRLVGRQALADQRGEGIIFALSLGMGVTGNIILACGLLGLFSPLLFRGGIVLGVLSVVFLLYRGKAFFGGSAAGSELYGKRLARISGIFFSLIAVFTAIAALAPPVGLEWDALSYHLANQKTWLQAGRIYYLPWDHHSNFPMTFQMIYLWMLGLGSIGAAKLIHWLCGVLLVASVYTFGRRYSGKSVGIVAAALVAASPIVLWEATVAYIDLASALFTFLSFYAFWNGRQSVSEVTERDSEVTERDSEVTERDSEKVVNGTAWCILSAILMGFALGSKYTVLGFWGMGLLGALYGRWRATNSPSAAIRAAVLWGGISLLVAAPWYLKTMIYTGNPVYPFAYSLFGGKYWSAENAALYAGEQAKFGVGKDMASLLLSPWQVTNEPLYLTPQKPFIYTEYIFYGFGLSPAFLALLLILPIAGGRLTSVSRACLLFGVGVFAFWFFLMQQTRYLIPALPFFAIVMAEMVVTSWESGRISRWFIAGMVAISSLWGLYIAGGMAFWGVNGPLLGLRPVAPVVFGAISPQEYIERRLPGVGGASFWINANTAPTVKVALFDETRGFYLDRDYLWAQPNHAAGLIPWDSYASVDDWLNDFRKKGYTTLLLGQRDPAAPDDGQKWRTLFKEAESSGKITLAFEQAGTRVYLIP